MTLRVPFAPLPIDQSDVDYDLGPDSFVRPGVPAGRTVEFTIDDPAAYPGTTRTVWVHLPAQPGSKPLSCMVFQDGWWYLDPDASVRGAIVLDNLIHDGAIPPMVGVFVDPGVFPDRSDPTARKNRNAEYDAADSRYADFLVDEVLPRVSEFAKLSGDPRRRGLCGGSSGGNGSFTAAWQRPDAFGRVLALVSSFAQMPGGNPYPRLLAAGERRPLRIFLQASHRDLGWNEPEDNWLAENLEVAAALARSGADFRFVLGDGGHASDHGAALLPDALRWLWRA
ncbi:esterase family protein [Calidifontibacter sp. DB0510]|uniref:Esterase family protein n=1 Tax=Metallococcus carri TaxID=1656884 RepID=A0A967B4M3_9MICO|nr:alpha/beta hydrolase-fold protein [Metallococcus carri]NHN57190.1 esterase family protein [Metallococcus carri]NOP38007.1 esterase family protein [Calidifontibacter sp. DB2511S]